MKNKIIYSITAFLLIFILTVIPISQVSFLNLSMTADAASIKLNKTSTYVTVDKTVQLKLLGTSVKPKWSTSNKLIATVTSTGVVKGIKAGNVYITAIVNNKKYKCKVTVEAVIKNKPNMKIVWMAGDSGSSSLVMIKVTNNGDLPITFNFDGYVYNDGYSSLNDSVNLYDGDSDDEELIDSVKVSSGETKVIYYRTDDYSDFWIDDDSIFFFNFTYDKVKFHGILDFGNYTYKQGFIAE